MIEASYRGWTIRMDSEGYAILIVPTGSIQFKSNCPMTLQECKERIDLEMARMAIKKAVG